MQPSQAIEGITQHNVETIARMEKAAVSQRTVGERTADVVAQWVGSWTFLIVQSILLAGWILLNLVGWNQGWDPYPFVLLNLVLSFQAAFATPIILMSENRQARLNERRDHLDLQVNLLAEQENTEQLRLLRLICDKLQILITEPHEKALEQPVEPDTLVRQIVETVEVLHPHGTSHSESFNDAAGAKGRVAIDTARHQ